MNIKGEDYYSNISIDIIMRMILDGYTFSSHPYIPKDNESIRTTIIKCMGDYILCIRSIYSNDEYGY